MDTHRSAVPSACPDSQFSYVASTDSKESLVASDVSKTLDLHMDTVHYLSPASQMSPAQLSMYEGDFAKDYDYDFMREELFPIEGEASQRSTSATSSIPCHEPTLQRTVAIVQPDAMIYQDVIERKIIFSGFTILQKRLIHFTPEQVSEIFSQLYGTPAFPFLVVSMSAAPVLTLVIACVDAVAKWRDMVGPQRTLKPEWFYPLSMRIRFGREGEMFDAVHASQNYMEAQKENRYINPEGILEPITAEHELVNDYCTMFINPTLVAGLADLIRVKPIDPIIYLAEWLLQNNPYQPQFPETIALLPT